jgi:hypothetical protein
MPEIKDITQEITKAVRDAAYVVVGLGVLGVQRAQVRRQELVKRLAEPRTQIEAKVGDARGEFTKRFKDVDTAVEQVIERLEAAVEPIEGRLPTQVHDLVKQAHIQARDARQQIRTLLQNVA